MLRSLYIKNYALIEELTVDLNRGFSIITGETGSGKSIIIDAIHLLVGGRGSTDFVRHGEKRAEIEGLFQILNNHHPIYLKSKEFGIELEDEMIVLRREIYKSGKSVCRINGKLVTISTLREIGSTLVDIHGQHEHQELMDDSEDYNDKFDDPENAGEEEISISKKQDKGRDVELSSEERVLMFKVNQLSINFSFLFFGVSPFKL
jgi:DNA repair protein RecN (Recombination protein N)